MVTKAGMQAPSADGSEPVAGALETPTGVDPIIPSEQPGGPAAAEPTVAEDTKSSPDDLAARIAALEAELAGEKAARAKAERDKELATKAQSALDRKLAELTAKAQQPSPDWDARLEAARARDDARGDGKDTAEQAVLQARAKAQRDAATSQLDDARNVMGLALQEAGISLESWAESEEMEDTRLKWQMAVSVGDFRTANRIATRVAARAKNGTVPTPALQPAKPVSASQPQPPARKSAAQRSAEMDMSGGSVSGAGVRLTEDNIDKLYMDWERNYPERPNPYARPYREFLQTGVIRQ